MQSMDSAEHYRRARLERLPSEEFEPWTCVLAGRLLPAHSSSSPPGPVHASAQVYRTVEGVVVRREVDRKLAVEFGQTEQMASTPNKVGIRVVLRGHCILVGKRRQQRKVASVVGCVQCAELRQKTALSLNHRQSTPLAKGYLTCLCPAASQDLGASLIRHLHAHDCLVTFEREQHLLAVDGAATPGPCTNEQTPLLSNATAR